MTGGDNEEDDPLNKENPEFPETSSCCCIYHEFYRAALKNLNKIAVIHAIGGARLAVERLRHRNNDLEAESVVSSRDHNPHPPVYDGDRCFTYSDVLSAVDNLSFRLRNILNGGDDPCLIRPNSGKSFNQYTEHAQIYNACNISKEQFREFYNDDVAKLIGVYMTASVEYIIAILSILRSGHVFLPLDASLPKDRVLSILVSSNVDLIIGQNYLDDKGSTQQHSGLFWDAGSCSWPTLCISIDVLLREKPNSLHLYRSCGSRNLGMSEYVMYTSGSTGKPKGFCGTEQGLLNRFMWMNNLYPFHEEEILMFKTSISFVDHLQEFLAAMLSCCTLVVPPLSALKENVLSLVLLLQDYSVSRLIAVPSLMRTLLPALQNPYSIQIQHSLKMLVLSGEVFPITLWHVLSELLPNTTILNLYGSTEVSGDCTYFDCKRLPVFLESEVLTSVPIGVPISNCNVMLLKDRAPDEGEICVSGICLSSGYLSAGKMLPLECMELLVDSLCVKRCGNKFFKTGDYARELPSGDLVFIGRKDRTVKVNGQRIALEEIENTLRAHPDVAGAAVILQNNQGKQPFLGAFLVMKVKTRSAGALKSVRSWMINKLPAAMVPARLIPVEAIPTSSAGKVDYTSLSDSFPTMNHRTHHLKQTELLEHIKEVFSDALAVAEVGTDDDFFKLGGDSIVAAQVAYQLGINMSLMYMYPSPSMLENALLGIEGGSIVYHQLDQDTVPKTDSGTAFESFDSETSDPVSETSDIGGSKQGASLPWSPDANYPVSSKRLKVNRCRYLTIKDLTPMDLYPWGSNSSLKSCTLGRCNKVMLGDNSNMNELCQQSWEIKQAISSRGRLRNLWKVHMISCVDASPAIAFKNEEVLLFIGSHSHKFSCINAQCGFVKWETELAGRIEGSAVIDGDLSQVVVGCYQGRIYFLDILTGNICWSFQTYGEVKSQPVVDKKRHLVWCGAHDHNLYGLDYRNHCCVYQYSCGGSVFSSPTIDEVCDILYVATTNGRLTAISVKDIAFSMLWLVELEAPVFGSLALSSARNVVCCLVNGHVVTLDYKGSIVWMVRVGGPIFSGACISKALPSQVLVCSRDGYVYSLKLEDGSIVWEYNVGDPITSSAYVDEELQLATDSNLPPDRLVCICSSSGRIILLRCGVVSSDGSDHPQRHWVEKFAKLDLEGDIFSSPVMIGGRIFVGCRDGCLHCVVAEAQISP